MPQGHRHQKRAVLTRSSTLTCRLPQDSACSARRFRRARCSIRCSADNSESVTDTPLYSNCSVFRNMYYLRLPCSARFSNGDFSHCGELTISAHHRDLHLTCRHAVYRNCHIFHTNGGFRRIGGNRSERLVGCTFRLKRNRQGGCFPLPPYRMSASP